MRDRYTSGGRYGSYEAVDKQARVVPDEERKLSHAGLVLAYEVDLLYQSGAVSYCLEQQRLLREKEQESALAIKFFAGLPLSPDDSVLLRRSVPEFFNVSSQQDPTLQFPVAQIEFFTGIKTPPKDSPISNEGEVTFRHIEALYNGKLILEKYRYKNGVVEMAGPAYCLSSEGQDFDPTAIERVFTFIDQGQS